MTCFANHIIALLRLVPRRANPGPQARALHYRSRHASDTKLTPTKTSNPLSWGLSKHITHFLPKVPNMFHQSSWENDPHFLYLGSERNPKTGKAYDFWLHDNESPTARDGDRDSDYGSHSVSDVEAEAFEWFRFLHISNKDGIKPDSHADMLWGTRRAVQLALEHWARTKTHPKNQPSKY